MLHHTSLVHRRNHLYNKLPLTTKWITDEPDETEIRRHYCCDPLKPLKYSQVSLWFKHCLAYQEILTSNDDRNLILEDDLLFDKTSITQASKIQLPTDYDIFYLGNVYSIIDGKPHTATDSYFVSKRCCEYLLAHKQISIPCDNHISKLPLKVYKADPPLFYQGTSIGYYESSITADQQYLFT